MKRIAFDQTGPAEDVLYVREEPLPEPKLGQVRVRVRAAPVNPSDALFVRGMYGIQPTFPHARVGFEGAGEVDAVGTGIGPELKLGQGKRVAFGGLGSWSEYVVVPATALMPLPDHVTFEEGAQFFVNPLTAYGLLDEANLKASDWLLTTAGSSAVNKTLIPLARDRGIRVIATVRHADQVAPLLARGAYAVVNVAEEDLARTVNSLTAGKGVHACFEAVGGEQSSVAQTLLRSGGLLLVYGMMSEQPGALRGDLLIFKDIVIRGFWLNNWLEKAGLPKIISTAKAIYDRSQYAIFRPEVGKTFPLADAAQAIAYSEESNRAGKSLLTC